MAKYQCVIALNGQPRYFKGGFYDFPEGTEIRDKAGNLDKHFVLVEEPKPKEEPAIDEKPAARKAGRPPKTGTE